MITTSLFNKKGNKTKKSVELNETIFASKVNEKLIQQAVRVFNSNQRQSNAHTKIRSEVRGGGKKPWANNKVAKARSSSIRNPIWKGGGVTFGPRNDKAYKLKMSKKMKKQAYRSLLTIKYAENQIAIIENLEVPSASITKTYNQIVDNTGFNGKITFVLSSTEEGKVKGLSAIKNVSAIYAGTLNIYDLMNNDIVLIEESALSMLDSYWSTSVVPNASNRSKMTKKIKPEGDELDLTDIASKKVKKTKSIKDLKKVVGADIKVKKIDKKTNSSISKSTKQ